MTEQQFLKEYKRLLDIAIQAEKSRSEFLLEAAQYAPLKVGDRIKYKHGKSTEAEVSAIIPRDLFCDIAYDYYVRPVLKSGELGLPTRAYIGRYTDIESIKIN